MSDAYNGWTNRETWACHLWITNEHATYSYWMELIAYLRRNASADSAVVDGVWTPAMSVKFRLQDALRHEFENVWALSMEHGDMSAKTAKCLYDIGSLWRVDWSEIAMALIGDAT